MTQQSGPLTRVPTTVPQETASLQQDPDPAPSSTASPLGRRDDHGHLIQAEFNRRGPAAPEFYRSLNKLLQGAVSRIRGAQWSSCQLAVAAAAFIVAADNARLFGSLWQRLDLVSFSGLVYLVMVSLALTTVLTLTILMLGPKYLLKPVIAGLLLLASALGSVSQAWGTIFDVEMIRNAVETYRDNNSAEAMELLSLPLAQQVLLKGIFPVLLVVLARVRYRSIGREILLRLRCVGILVALVVAMFFVNFKFSAFFSRENRDLRCSVIPIYALYSVEHFATDEQEGDQGQILILGQDAVRETKQGVRTVGVMVVGETARADHFSLNGYGRPTNPLLEQRLLLNYTNVSASGTSTAYSVPCMFSFLDREDYKPKKASRQSNVLDVLLQAGVHVAWVDNNSSSKGVCDRVGSIRLGPSPGVVAPDRKENDLFDEMLMPEMERQIDSTEGDVLIVLHAMGSHGPAYHLRYPPEFDQFQPSCQRDAPQSCSDEELINAYDNTLLYTDYILDSIIARLQDRPDTEATFLLYVSDHGESLGENGIYLHGMPYFMAPDAQIHVPMLAWMSEAYLDAYLLDFEQLELATENKVSHDNISHSLLGLFDVQTELLREDLNLFQ